MIFLFFSASFLLRSAINFSATSGSNDLANSPLRMIVTARIRSPFSMALTTFIPSTTSPKTECLLSRCAVGTCVIKNWLPFVLAPALAIERIPGLLCFRSG